jgi:hypothetical protein
MQNPLESAFIFSVFASAAANPKLRGVSSSKRRQLWRKAFQKSWKRGSLAEWGSGGRAAVVGNQ